MEALASGAMPSTAAQREEASELHFSAHVPGARPRGRVAAGPRPRSEAAGIEAKVLKGRAVAHLDYPDPAQRMFADIDLLVRSDDLDSAVAVLGGRVTVAARSSHGPASTGASAKVRPSRPPSGHEIDLHRTFVMGPFGLRLRLDDLWDARPLRAGGPPVGALDAECRFLHACYHAALGRRRPAAGPAARHRPDGAVRRARPRPGARASRRLGGGAGRGSSGRPDLGHPSADAT